MTLALYNPAVKSILKEYADYQYQSYDNLLDICEQRLQSQIQQASTTVKEFFGLNEVTVQCLADLKKLPIRTATDIWNTQQQNPPFGIYNGYPYDQIRSSKGTTGYQKYWPFTDHAWIMFMIGKIRLLEKLKLTSNDILMSLDVGATPLGIKTTVDACAMCYNVKILPAGVLPVQKKADLVIDHQVSAIVGLPSAITSIGRALQNKTNPIKKIISVGESIDPYIVDLANYFPDAVIQNDIGSSELSALMFVCSHGSTHFNIDLTWADHDINTGLFNSTGLTSALPIFNYQTGDRINKLTQLNCKCGSCLPTVEAFVERS